MRFNVSLAYQETADVLELARAAEDLGYDGIALPDRAALPLNRTTAYPYRADGTTPFGTGSAYPDPLVLLAAVAATTERLCLFTRTLILPVHDPLLLAKAAATCALVSGGRLVLGVGTGWLREEFTWTSTRFEGRGGRTDEAIALLRKLWSGGVVEHRGEHFDIGPMVVDTVPSDIVPIFVGGDSDRALDRAALLGDGYMTVPHRLSTLRPILEHLRSRRDATSRGPLEIDVACTDADEPRHIAELQRLGATSLTVTPWLRTGQSGDDQRARLQSMKYFATRFIDRERSL